jgi:3-oxoacyl-[acyl-carrier protein] reductase
MDLELKGRTALVMAGSQGLGRGIAEAWAAEGVAVAVLARSKRALDETVAAIGARGGKGIALVCDLARWPTVADAVAEAQVALGPIDILLLNNGGPALTKPTGVPVEVWEEQFQMMVTPMVRLVELLLPDMRARRFGRIMHVSAPGIITPTASTSVSQAMRLAVAGWLKGLAAEVARDGVTVNTLVPGMIETKRLHEVVKRRADADGITVEEQLKRQVADIPAGRMGTPREFGAVAAFLASPLAAYMTGSIVKIDGGWIHAL